MDGWNPAKAGATGTSNFDVWATFTSGGSLTSRQIQGDGTDQHLAYVTNSNAYWYLTDRLGSTRATINNSGTVQDSIVYDAYGNITSQSNASAAPLYTYTGRELDVETGLQYNRARWYDPGTGRWISQDPMGFDAGDSNLYRYVLNAPTVLYDSSGLKPRDYERDLIDIREAGSPAANPPGVPFSLGNGRSLRYYRARQPDVVMTVGKDVFKLPQTEGILLKLETPDDSYKNIDVIQFLAYDAYIERNGKILRYLSGTCTDPDSPLTNLKNGVTYGFRDGKLTWYVDSVGASGLYVGSGGLGGTKGNSFWMFDAPNTSMAIMGKVFYEKDPNKKVGDQYVVAILARSYFVENIGDKKYRAIGSMVWYSSYWQKVVPEGGRSDLGSIQITFPEDYDDIDSAEVGVGNSFEMFQKVYQKRCPGYELVK